MMRSLIERHSLKCMRKKFLDKKQRTSMGYLGIDSWSLMLLALFFWHYIADYPLQGDFLSREKNPYRPEKDRYAPWTSAMLAHVWIHAFGVLIITGSFVAFLVEFVLHWFIDVVKCKYASKLDRTKPQDQERLMGAFGTDQGVHLLCKVVYVLALWSVYG